MVRMDVTDLKFGDSQFDFIFCISVMQYVKDDLQGFREMCRVLKPGGRLLFASAVDENRKETMIYEKPSVDQSYVVRVYGRDIAGLMARAGFSVEKFNYTAGINADQRKKYGISNDPLYLLTRK